MTNILEKKLTSGYCCPAADKLLLTPIAKWVWTVLKWTCLCITDSLNKACDLSSSDYSSIQEVALVYCQLDLIKALTPADPADPQLSEV